jgi:hypothetical protein
MNRSLQHSGLGITGIVLGALSVFVLLLDITLWMIFRANNHLTFVNQLILTGLAIFNVVIVVFGLASSLKGILQQERKKTLAIIGLVLNLFVFLLYISGIIISII